MNTELTFFKILAAKQRESLVHLRRGVSFQLRRVLLVSIVIGECADDDELARKTPQLT
jgi:hypothetical protein